MTVPETQRLQSCNFALEVALKVSLRRIATVSGDRARPVLLRLGKNAVDAFRNSVITTDRGMEHADALAPAVDAIETVFLHVLREVERPRR